ncbi:MAG: glycosyltransferase family protein [Patescibacteria group bacterium]
MEKIKTICIIQARMNSTRLPGKILMKAGGRTILENVLIRVGQAKKIGKIVVATTDRREDDVTEKLCRKIGVDCFRGSENDVLDRFYQCALFYRNYSVIIRINADCPLTDPQIIDKVINIFFREKVDYASNVIPPTFPDGLDVEVFSFNILKNMWKKAKKSHEREHVTAHIRDNPRRFRIANLNNEKDISRFRFTVDYKDDIKLINNLLKLLPRDFVLEDILKVLKQNDSLIDINKKYRRHDGFSSWKKNCFNFKK